MKLLFVIGSLQGGGAEHVLTTVCNNLSERGHEVLLLYDFRWKDYVVSKKVREIDTNTFEKDTSKGNIFKRYYNKAANRIRDLFYFKNLLKVERPDAVTIFLENWSWQLTLLCKGRIPLVFSERNTFDYKYNSFSDWVNKHLFYRMGDMVTTMTYYDKAFLRKRYKNITVMHNPLSYLPLTVDKYNASFNARKDILACGRLVPDKGFSDLIEAFSKIAHKYPEWNIDIAGRDMQNSNYSCVLKELVKKHNLEDRIRFIGFHHNINEIMQEHSIFTLSSKREGFPNVLSEALSMGCACLSYDIVTGPREIIIDGLDGLIVENRNIDALADGLEKLIKDENLRYRMGLKAIENIKRFSPDQVIDRWEQMYKSIYNKGKSRNL